MAEPLVSVIMPVYNSEHFLEDAIRSVINQLYLNWELWLIDDNSTDNSKEIISNFTSIDKRIKSIFLTANSGTAIARNTAILKCTGKYIAFLDADDIWLPEKLMLQINSMEMNERSFTFSCYTTMDENGKDLKKTISAPKTVTYKQLLKNNTIGCLTAIYNSEKLGKMLMPEIRKRQDYGLWLNILKTGVIGYGIQQPLAIYRIRESSLSNKKTNVLKYNWILLRKHQKLSLISALYYFSCFLFNKTIKYMKQ